MRSHLKHMVILLSVLRSILGSPGHVRVLRRRTTRLFRTCLTALRPFSSYHLYRNRRERANQKSNQGLSQVMDGAPIAELPSQFCGGIINFNIQPQQLAVQQQPQPRSHSLARLRTPLRRYPNAVKGRSTAVTSLLALVIVYLRLLYTHHE